MNYLREINFLIEEQGYKSLSPIQMKRVLNAAAAAYCEYRLKSMKRKNGRPQDYDKYDEQVNEERRKLLEVVNQNEPKAFIREIYALSQKD